MKRLPLFIAGLIVAGLIAGCGPVIVVQNNTRIPVRAVVTSNGRSEVLSPSPGESSTAEAGEGPYTVTVIPDQEWIDYARATRKFLNDQLANSDNLTGPQLLQVVQRLKAVAAQMQEFENAAGKSQSCSGTLTSDGGGSVQVSTGADGALVVSCP